MSFVQLVGVYPTVAKQIRDYYRNQMKEKKHDDDDHEHHHCCGFMALEQGLGHEDLDKLMRQPQPLNFTFGRSIDQTNLFLSYQIVVVELIKVLQPGEYEKDTYLLNDEDKKRQIPMLKATGNELYKEGKYTEAVEKYGQALQFFEDLMLK